jgi:hypothetical protein
MCDHRASGAARLTNTDPSPSGLWPLLPSKFGVFGEVSPCQDEHRPITQRRGDGFNDRAPERRLGAWVGYDYVSEIEASD